MARVQRDNTSIEPKKFLESLKPEVFSVMEKHIPSKVALRLECVFVHWDGMNGTMKEEKQISSTTLLGIILPCGISKAWEYYKHRIMEMGKKSWKKNRDGKWKELKDDILALQNILWCPGVCI